MDDLVTDSFRIKVQKLPINLFHPHGSRQAAAAAVSAADTSGRLAGGTGAWLVNSDRGAGPQLGFVIEIWQVGHVGGVGVEAGLGLGWPARAPAAAVAWLKRHCCLTSPGTLCGGDPGY